MDDDSLFSVSIEKLADKQQLANAWCELESRIERPFFLSWNWIGTWIDTFVEDAWCVTVRSGEEIVGLGVFVELIQRRHLIIKSRQLVLHATGRQEQDVITIEYNNLLCDAALEADIWAAVLEKLKDADVFPWDEIVLPGVTSDLEAKVVAMGYSAVRTAEAGSARVDLKALAREGVEGLDGFVSTLGKNTRGQIRRSLRLYGESGEIVIERAEKPEEAWTWLEEAGEYHRLRWQQRGGTGALDRPGFVAFHKRLIEQNFSAGVLEILRIRAGDMPFAWLYNFLDRGHVYFYFCAFRFENDNRMKPGLSAHALCIADHLGRGSAVYDFMAGDSQYKTSLATPGPEIIRLSIQQDRFSFSLESRLKRLKQLIQDLLKKA